MAFLRRPLVGALVLTGLMVACSTVSEDGLSQAQVVAPLVERLGGDTTVFDDGDRAFQASLRNMSIDDAQHFAESNKVFEADFTEADGLDVSLGFTGCLSCHDNNGRGDPNGVITYKPLEISGFELQKPTIKGDAVSSHRVAPALVGMGLLESIPDSVIEALADPDDTDGDGISGRIHYVTDPSTGQQAIGRFGWQASEATVLSQTATALETDLGILTPLLSGDAAEIDESTVELLSYYNEGLAVPARRNADDPDNAAGGAVFESIGCASCHTPMFTTGDVDLVPLSNQEIWPYTDMLIHDMGPDMATDLTLGDAAPTEFRTAPLWSLGLHFEVNGSTGLLHDGRAQSIEGAILWHGGEAAASRDQFLELNEEDRTALLFFLENL